MKPKHTMKFALRTAALAAAFSGTAQAAVIIEAASAWQLEKRMTSANGNVVIGEFTNRLDADLVGYEVDLSSSTQIHFFAVSHGESDPGSISAPSGWTFTNVAKADWAGRGYGFFNTFSGATLGSFESLFGTVDTHVIVFTAPNGSVSTTMPGPGGIPMPGGPSMPIPGSMSDFNNPSTPNSDSNEANWSAVAFTPRFIRGGSDASEFIAVSTSGSIIAQSIPEPSSALLGSLAALALLRRRR